jgi:hypothetical protein
MRKVFSEQNLGVNPYLEGLIIPYLTKTKRTEHVQSTETLTSKIDSSLSLNYQYHIESQRYTKVFISLEMRKLITSLSDKATKLLWFISYDLFEGKQYYVANKAFIVKELKFPHQRELDVYFNELINKGLLQKTAIKNAYWVTPSIFKGNRLIAFKNNLTSVNKEIAETYNDANYTTEIEFPTEELNDEY